MYSIEFELANSKLMRCDDSVWKIDYMNVVLVV